MQLQFCNDVVVLKYFADRCAPRRSLNYYSTDNVYFYENFSHRIDALRHHDKRRELLRRGEDPLC